MHSQPFIIIHRLAKVAALFIDADAAVFVTALKTLDDVWFVRTLAQFITLITIYPFYEFSLKP